MEEEGAGEEAESFYLRPKSIQHPSSSTSLPWHAPLPRRPRQTHTCVTPASSSSSSSSSSSFQPLHSLLYLFFHSSSLSPLRYSLFYCRCYIGICLDDDRIKSERPYNFCLLIPLFLRALKKKKRERRRRENFLYSVVRGKVWKFNLRD